MSNKSSFEASLHTVDEAELATVQGGLGYAYYAALFAVLSRAPEHGNGGSPGDGVVPGDGVAGP